MNYIEEQYDTLVKYANNEYLLGVNKYPNDASLHISYAFFLIEFMASRHLALEELNIAEDKKPMLDHQFMIFRQRKLIEDEIYEN